MFRANAIEKRELITRIAKTPEIDASTAESMPPVLYAQIADVAVTTATRTSTKSKIFAIILSP